MKDKNWVVLKTHALLMIHALLEKCQTISSMHVLIGSTGCGKTFSFDLYRDRHEHVYYFKIEKTYTAKEFYLLLLSAVGVHDYDRTVPMKSMAQRFAAELRENEGKTLLIFDEAGKFSSDMCEYFQTIRDSTQENVGIILSGTEKFRTDMESWKSKRRKGIPELFSRIWSWEDIPKPSENEKYQVVKENGVTNPSEIKKIVKMSPDFRQVYQNVMQYKYDQKLSKVKPTEQPLQPVEASDK